MPSPQAHRNAQAYFADSSLHRLNTVCIVQRSTGLSNGNENGMRNGLSRSISQRAVDKEGRTG